MKCWQREICRTFRKQFQSTYKTPSVRDNVLIGADCSPEEIEIYMALFKEVRDIFAWSYEEMPGIDPRIVEHEIKTYYNV